MKYLTLSLALMAGFLAMPPLMSQDNATPDVETPATAHGDWIAASSDADWKAALAQAKRENKLVLVDFTGSDWCGWCKKLKAEVFDTPEFKNGAPKGFVLVEVDMPRANPPAQEVQAYRQQLAQKYGVRGYPTILVLDSTGEKVGKTGYQAGGPVKYLQHLEKMRSDHMEYEMLKAKAAAGDADAQAQLEKVEKVRALKDQLGRINQRNAQKIAKDIYMKYTAGDRLTGADASSRYYVIILQGAIMAKDLKTFDEIRPLIEKAAETDKKLKMQLSRMPLDSIREKIAGESGTSDEGSGN